MPPYVLYIDSSRSGYLDVKLMIGLYVVVGVETTFALNHHQDPIPRPSSLAINANVLEVAAVPALIGTHVETCLAAANGVVANGAVTAESAIATHVMVGIRHSCQVVVATNAPGTSEAVGASVAADPIALSALIRGAVICANIVVKRAITARHGRLDSVVRVDSVLGT